MRPGCCSKAKIPRYARDDIIGGAWGDIVGGSWSDIVGGAWADTESNWPLAVRRG